MTRPARGQAVGQAFGHRADAGDRHHAEHDAGDEDAETAQAAAQLAPGQAQGKRHHAGSAGCNVGATVIRPECRLHHAVAARRQRGVVRHQNERGAMIAVAAKQQFDDLAAG